MKKFWIRTASSVVYVALFLGTMMSDVLIKNRYYSALVFLAFMLFVACGCTFEFYRITKMRGGRPMEWLGYAEVCLVVGCGYIACYSELYTYSLLFACIFLFFPISSILLLWRKTDPSMDDIGRTFIPVLYIALPLSHMLMLQIFDISYLLLIVALVWINDACAYMLGSLIGEHKMWPKYSPGKTWEGTLSGVVFAMVAGTCAALCWPSALHYHADWWQGAIVGLICGVIGTLGDLVESMLKRSVGLKDSGKILPGHGGFLDRFDSLLLVIPFAIVFYFFCSSI